ncbi:hypothetical protein MMC16_005169 [Acarospora aff. strigata]|nr:hypothetical protein [Acarospora aff. strigata]
MEPQQVPPSQRTLPDTLTPDHPNYDTILQRADQIQRRKDAEQQILAATEALLDTGSDSEGGLSHESVVAVKGYLKLFQPSDYDSLIEERNINGKCGYMLCARSPRSENTEARFRIITGKGNGENAFKVVSRKKLEQWCSEHCAKKGLYLRVQLSEEPAWLRAEGVNGEPVLLEEVEAKENNEVDVIHLAKAIQGMDLQAASEQMARALDALAVERGEVVNLGTSSALGEVVIHENLTTSAGESIDLDLNDVSHYESIEGYKPQGAHRTTGQTGRIPDESKNTDA